MYFCYNIEATNMTIPLHSAYLAQNRDAVLENNLLGANTLDFYNSLFQFQESAYQEIKKAGFDLIRLEDTGLPLLNGNKFSFPEEMRPFFDNALDELLMIVETHQQDILFDSLASMLHDDYSLYLQLAGHLVNRDMDSLQEYATKAKTDMDGLLFVIINLLKPVFISLREDIMGDQGQDNWEEAACPFCSFMPDMAKIVASKNNKRILHCALCEHEWQFKRVCCTVCGNQDTETLGYYTYEDNELYRFDYCEKCRAYIKTLQIPEQFDDSRYDLTVENILTSFLDASALDMGYVKP